MDESWRHSEIGENADDPDTTEEDVQFILELSQVLSFFLLLLYITL